MSDQFPRHPRSRIRSTTNRPRSATHLRLLPSPPTGELDLDERPERQRREDAAEVAAGLEADTGFRGDGWGSDQDWGVDDFEY